jgi:hypothetical protein
MKDADGAIISGYRYGAENLLVSRDRIIGVPNQVFKNEEELLAYYDREHPEFGPPLSRIYEAGGEVWLRPKIVPGYQARPLVGGLWEVGFVRPENGEWVHTDTCDDEATARENARWMNDHSASQ